MEKFILSSKYKPTGDQPEAIKRLTKGIKDGLDKQILLGVTGSGKTFTAANVIVEANRPTLVISHNKTLAAQLYSEFKEFFPQNAVHFFVSYYDYYQPEAYVPRTDTYIEKDSDINEEIDRLRNAATSALLSRSDVIIVASVSCIYGLGDPEDYLKMRVDFEVGQRKDREKVLRQLTEIQYERNDKAFERGRFRVRGDVLDIFSSYDTNFATRVIFDGNIIESIKQFNPITGEIIEKMQKIAIFPARHFVTPKEKVERGMVLIEQELQERVAELKAENKLLEAQRLSQRTMFDLEMMRETGYCSGIENYSRILAGRAPGVAPATLIDFFPDDFLLLIDESHMSVPQIRGMYNGDRARKETLVEYGFRLPSALDNRPLKFEEFEKATGQTIYISATPGTYEFREASENKIYTGNDYYKASGKEKFPWIAEQLIRPTGLLDPEIDVRKTEHQIDDLLEEIRQRVAKKQRVLVTTLTKRMSEDLAEYLKEINVKVNYLHSEVNTLERPEILRDLRAGVYDVVVGVNLLREGLDLPEVSLVAILDADKEGFLRSEQALIQTIGRAARHSEGKVIMYADHITGSMKSAIDETQRRRKLQEEYNKKHGITPTSIKKAIKEGIGEQLAREKREREKEKEFDIEKVPKDEVERILNELRKNMKEAAKRLDFEEAAALRDQIGAIREELEKKKIK